MMNTNLNGMEGLAALYARRRLKGNKYVTFNVQNTVVGGKCSLIRSLSFTLDISGQRTPHGIYKLLGKINTILRLGCPKDKVTLLYNVFLDYCIYLRGGMHL